MRRDLFVPCFVLGMRFPRVGRHHDCRHATVTFSPPSTSLDIIILFLIQSVFTLFKKIKYLLNRLRAMPLANFSPNQFRVHVFSPPSKHAREPQLNNYVVYSFDQGKRHKMA